MSGSAGGYKGIEETLTERSTLFKKTKQKKPDDLENTVLVCVPHLWILFQEF